MTEHHLRFAPTVLKRLGEELIPNPDQGIIELVRNAYDADATSCTVELVDATTPGGVLRIEDDGRGMTEADIQAGWLVLGRSSKADGALTPRGRRPVGDKGLGRLGALRLGERAVLRTRPESEPGVEYSLELDWHAFDAADYVESVPLAIRKSSVDSPHGTSIEVSQLRGSLGVREVQRLARSLLLLSDPFENELGFRATLKAAEFRELERLVSDAYFDQAEYHLQASIDAKGISRATVSDWKGSVLWTTDHSGIARDDARYNTVPLTLEFWTFLLDSRSFASRTVTLREVQAWLRVVGGVHVYDRKLRVAPYGDPGHDWLELNLRRAQSPEERPSTNNSIGRILLGADPDSMLVQKTDRSGFIENDAFFELRRFAADALDWMARERLRTREQTRQAARTEAPAEVATAQNQLQQATAALSKEQREPVEKAVRRFEQAQERQIKALREDLFLYRALATVGTTAAVFAHESAKPAQEIVRMGRSVASRAKQVLGDQYDATLSEPVALIIQSAQALKTFAGLPLFLLARDKRRPGSVDTHQVIGNLIEAFRPVLQEEGVQIAAVLEANQPHVLASVSAIESIITNFITNSVNAFKSAVFVGPERTITVKTETSGEHLIIRVFDSGPGIRELDVSEIWLPGQTTTPDGTGLGLTIVRDSVRDLGGTVSAVAQGELGGAEFVVTLPTLAGGGM